MEQEVITIENERYPNRLRSIKETPKTLYIKGQFLQNEKCFAIVGTRRCSSYGKEVAFNFAKELSQAGIVIVSGLARGIDTMAHKGAIEGAGKTIAVLGTGLSEKVMYPKENISLAKEIVNKGGCLISEYPPETQATKFTFPDRNRIISGLSLGVLVVEAKFKSGALITSRYAKQQNKKVFATQGNIYSLNSKGPHELIKNGAILVEKPTDILKSLNIQQFLTTRKMEFSNNIENNSNKIEKSIIQILNENNSDIDEIIEKTQLKAAEISSCLSLMEIEGKIKNLGGNIYTLVR